MDKGSGKLHESALRREEDTPNVIHLTHLTTPQSIYHLRLGFPSLASKPYMQKWYISLMWPITACSIMLTWLYARTFISERNTFDKLKLQTWVIPKYSFQYFLEWQKGPINRIIEEAILDADRKGKKVVSLGLMNQDEELNMNGGLYVSKNPKLIVKVVDAKMSIYFGPKLTATFDSSVQFFRQVLGGHKDTNFGSSSALSASSTSKTATISGD
ncbi:unnamed protein product [Lupinus luteus]|uniref:Uncharacterized protein n=1 Tax=Lupinus luteus TaxID=3873 RepID=A0AAV1XME9_LUPLU